MVENLAYFTPTTLWFLKSKNFKSQKHQQMVRLIASFTVHDHFKGTLDRLIDMGALIKSPTELA